MKRRQLLKGGVAATLSAGLNPLTKLSAMTNQPRILVVFELSGGNDGLNTVIPYRNDDYYRARPNIGLRPNEILKLDDEWGMNLGLAGLKQQWDKGNVAVIHGCGYERPSYSHFTSMAYWHTASPNSGDAYGWCGKTADFLAPDAPENFIINIDTSQSLAVTSRYHTPVVFDDPDLSLKASPTLTWITLFVYGVWHSAPFSFIVFYAGLQTVPQDTVEAAMIDGASRWQRIRYVVVPYMAPLVTFITLMQLMDNFRVFEPIVGFSAQASATSLSYIIYSDLRGGDTQLFGSAAATSMLTILGVAVLLTPVLIRTWREFNRKPV